jgi:hypothetical protein
MMYRFNPLPIPYHLWTAIFYRQTQFPWLYEYRMQPAAVVHLAQSGRRDWSLCNPAIYLAGYTQQEG